MVKTFNGLSARKCSDLLWHCCRTSFPAMIHVTIRIILAFVILFLQKVDAVCNITAYEDWKLQTYTGILAVDSSFWIYQTQPQIVLTNELAQDLAVTQCVRLFDLDYYYLAGRMGPVSVQYGYKTMCKNYCLESDRLHLEALTLSGCSCLELSTQPTDDSYHIEGDYCLENSARQLCSLLGYCGVWNCRIDDFMCPRYEWNKKTIPLKGIGSCVRGDATRASIHYAVIISLVIALFVNIIL